MTLKHSPGPAGVAALALLNLVLGAPNLAAQGTAADYARAANLAKLTADKVFRDQVKPQWLADGTHFWYRVRTGSNTHEFVLVDAANGVRQPAFDHERLAAALAQAGVKEVRADALGLARLEWDLAKRQVEFECDGKSWRCALDSYALEPALEKDSARSARARRAPPQRSTRTGPETSVVFFNRTEIEVELFWLDPEGQRHSYGKLAPRERRSQHTFAGHVWLAVDAQGETLAAFEAEEEPASVDIQPGGVDTAAAPRGRQGPPPPQDVPSPDGQWRAFIKDGNIHLRNTKSGSESALSTDGNPDNSYALDALFWSPDSTHLAALRTPKGAEHKVHYVESSPADQVQPKLQSIDYLKPGDEIPLAKPQLFEIATARQLPVSDALFPNPWSIEEVRWARDSRRFTFLYNQRGHQVLRVVAVDAATGACTPIIEETSATFIDYAHKRFTHYLDDTGELIWMSERDGWNHLYLYDAKTGAVRNQITRGEWVVRGVDHVDAAKRQVFFRASGLDPGQDPYYIHYCRIGLDGTGLVRLTEGDGAHTATYSPDRRYLVDTWSRVDLAPVTELRRVEDGRRVCALEQSDLTLLRQTGWQAPERFVAKGRDGVTDIYGVIYRPATFNPQTKYPVIEDIYAGPQDSFVPKAFRPFYKPQAMAELGFIVVQIDGMGTSNRSKRFHDVCWRNLGDAGFPDRILWIKAAAEQHPFMDLARVGIYGGSAGGQSSTRALLAHGDFYQVAVSDCGCHDNRMDKIWWNELWMGWPVGPHYAEQSNVTQAHRLQGKLLLIFGELDHNVDPSSTMQVVNALIKADKDFDLLIVPGAGHGAAERPYGTRRRQDFFVRHLLGVTPRAQAQPSK
jgi:dipeptidyl aminopeptidase/acylaminoacyl peptidase